MSGIHDEILTKVRDELQVALIDEIAEDDPTIVGVVKLGELQGEPEEDVARISVTLHENDPDAFISGAFTGMSSAWNDEVYDVEVGGVVTWRRRFTVKARCLMERTREDLLTTREIVSTVRSRIEETLLGISFSGVMTTNEYVARGIVSDELLGEMRQSGGPPDSYDYFIKFRFEVLTTKT